MNIVFDFEIQGVAKLEDCTFEEQIILKAIWDYTFKSLSHLEYEMTNEEDESKKDVCVGICLTSEPKRIQPINYSKQLTKKILSSFDEKVLEKMLQSLGCNLSALMN